MIEIKSTLKKFDLTDNEIDIYLLLLSIGEASASTLSYRSKMAKNSCRYLCDQLIEKGLVSSKKMGNTFYYKAESPEKILFLLDAEERALQEKKEEFGRIMGDLVNLTNPSSALPKVNFYEGKSGMIELYESILDLNSPIKSFEDKGDMVDLIPDYIPHYVKRRIESKIPCQTICPEGNTINNPSKKKMLDVRKIKKEDFPFTCDIKICEDLISMFSFQKAQPVGIAIKNKDIADNLRIIFDYFWKHL